MEKCRKFPSYITHEGRLYRRTNGRLALAPLSVMMHESGKRKLMRLVDVIKMFNMKSDEIFVDPDNRQPEEWRYVGGKDWVEVSSFGRVKVEGKLVEPVMRCEGAQLEALCGRRGSEDNFYRFTLWIEVMRQFIDKDYRGKKCIFIDGNKMNCRADNITNITSASLYKNNVVNNRQQAACGGDNEPRVKIKQRELESIIEFNTKASLEIASLKKENERLKSRIQVFNE